MSRWSRRGDNGLSSPKTDILSLLANSFWLVLSTTDTQAHADTPTRTLVSGRMKEAERSRRRDRRADRMRWLKPGCDLNRKEMERERGGRCGGGRSKVQTQLITAFSPEKYEHRVFFYSDKN